MNCNVPSPFEKLELAKDLLFLIDHDLMIYNNLNMVDANNITINDLDPQHMQVSYFIASKINGGFFDVSLCNIFIGDTWTSNAFYILLNMSIQIHEEIYTQLDTFYKENRVPNIIFHGRNGCGKKTIVKNYINKIYKTKEEENKYVLIVDCIQSNGIKFIREDLKFFSRSQINNQHGNNFKTIILILLNILE